jgi:archaellum biogenesis ATPase FlaH
MLPGSYDFGPAFQLRVLSLLIRQPEKAIGVIEPQYFDNPLHFDIASVICKTYEAHPKSRLTKTTLKELVKQSLSRKELRNWSYYKEAIRAAYRIHGSDSEIIFQQALEFAKHQKYRQAVIQAEKAVSDRRYDNVQELFEKLRKEDAERKSNSWKWKDLPMYQDFEFQEVDWHVEGILPAGSIVALSGDEGVGKTLFALALSRSVTQGREFLGRNVRFCRVLYLGLDISKATLQSYIRAMRWVPNDYFRILTMWTGEGREAPMLDDAEGAQHLHELAVKYKPLIIFDTLRDFFEGEENSSTEVKPVLDVLRKLRSLGATLILIVHPPKSGSSIIRGTGNISQKVDIPYLMEKSKWQGKDIVVLSCPKKNRFGATSFRLAMRQVFIPMPAGPYFLMREITDWEPSAQATKSEADNTRIVEYVKKHPGTNQEQIEGALKMGDRRVRRALREAKEDGTLISVGGKRKELLWYDAAEEKKPVSEVKTHVSDTANPS